MNDYFQNNYEYYKSKGTGDIENDDNFKIIIYPFEKYLIKLKLSSNNEFIGIMDICINKDFLNHKQRHMIQGFHDVNEFYKE